ncbi:uncharacterized protein LOC144881727 [Branchiostoma floridae x Branchiostoma japonicum]
MLRICEKLRQADAKTKKLGLKRTETDYLCALSDAMANMDRSVEVEVLKSLGDVNLERGKHCKGTVDFDRAVMLYRTALLQCEDAQIRESLTYRMFYADEVRLCKEPTTSIRNIPDTGNKDIPSFAKIASKFQHLDKTLAVDYKKDSFLIEYAKLIVEGIVNEDSILEVEAIKSLGDVYLKRGTETRDTPCLTKATALYNTALARCDWVQGKLVLVHRVLYTAQIRGSQKKSMTGNKKVVTYTGQQQQSHPTKPFPVTLSNIGVFADSTCHHSL